MNPDSCPAWSYYKHAADPRRDTGVQINPACSDAPHWAACEYWLVSGDATAWRDALTQTGEEVELPQLINAAGDMQEDPTSNHEEGTDED